MAKREASKCRVWERERRDRLKSCFTALGRLLPSYDPASPPSKLEVLQRAATLISELQQRNEQLLGGGAGTVAASAQQQELRRLQERVRRLLVRNEQLSALLLSAGIQPFRPQRKWSGRLGAGTQPTVAAPRGTPQGAAALPVAKRRRDSSKKKAGAGKKSAPAAANENVDVSNKQQPRRRRQTVSGLKKGRAAGKCVSLGAPVYTSPSLGPGTLILADGSVLPVVTQPPPPATTTTLILMHAARGARAIASRPGPGAKVPIPQLRSRPVLQPPPRTAPARRRQHAAPAAKPPRHQQQKNNKEKKSEKKGDTTELNVKLKQQTELKKNGLCSDTKSPTTQEDLCVKELIVDQSVAEDTCVKPTSTCADVDDKKQAEVSCTAVSPNDPDASTRPTTPTILKTSPPVAAPSDKPLPEMIGYQLNGDDVQVDKQQESDKQAIKEIAQVRPPVIPPPAIDQSELSNDDIFASLNVPGAASHQGAGGHHPESMSPTAAFLLAFPLVSTLTGGGGGPAAVSGRGAVAEDNSDSRQETPTLLQIGTMESSVTGRPAAPTSTTAPTSSLLALDTFTSFFTTPTTSTVPTTKKLEYNSTTTTKCRLGDEKKVSSSYNATTYSVSTAVGTVTAPPKETYNQQQCNTFNPFSDMLSPADKHYSAATGGYGATTAPATTGCSYEYNFLQESVVPNCPKTTPVEMAKPQSATAPTFNYTAHQDKRSSTSRPPVNWMTAPDNKSAGHSHADFCSAQFPGLEFNVPGPQPVGGGASHPQWLAGPEGEQRCGPYREEESNRWSWSPGRLLPPLVPGGGAPAVEHGGGSAIVNVPSTLPTLLGDLALSTGPQHHVQETLSHGTASAARETLKRSVPGRGARKQQPGGGHQYDVLQQQSTAFSVSQLVQDQQQQQVEPRVRRGGTKLGAAHQPRHASTANMQQKRKSEQASCFRQSAGAAAAAKWHQQHEGGTATVHGSKRFKQSSGASGSYSAEALIGGDSRRSHQYLQQQQPPPPPPLHHQQQQQQQQHGPHHHYQQQFQQVAGGSNAQHQYFVAAAAPVESEVPYSNFPGYGAGPPPAPAPAAFHNNTSYSGMQQPQHPELEHQTRGGSRAHCAAPRKQPRASKSSRHHPPPTAAEHLSAPPYVDLGFLTMPGAAMGSPLLPEEGVTPASTAGYPPPTPALYYGRHYGGGSPGTAANTSLTNFNLSTIFPEMGAAGGKLPYASSKPPPAAAYVPPPALPFTNS